MTISVLPFVFTSGVPRAVDDRRDRELLADLAAGSQEALAELYDRHAAALFRHALSLARRRPDAEDLVQTVFVKLSATGAELLAVRQPAGYLHRMLHTTWMDARRRAATGDRVVEQAAPDDTPIRPAVESRIDISRAMDELPEEQREVVVLHVLEGFSFREIGRLTGVSLFTAAGRYRLAVARLQRLLGASIERLT